MTGVAAPGAGPRPGSAVARRGGVLPLDKPAGITSFDAIRQVRRILGERRVGHAGTLDPTATGLLPICVGRSTRFVDYFHAQPKTYHCVVRLGERSDTGDTEGVVATGADAGAVTAEAIRAELVRFTGEIDQIPPMHSAVRHEGRHLYELARAGEEVVREPRRVTIHSAELVDFRPGSVAEAEIVVSSGKGAYMRVLASDLGDALGTGGLLGWLSRTSYGTLRLSELDHAGCACGDGRSLAGAPAPGCRRGPSAARAARTGTGAADPAWAVDLAAAVDPSGRGGGVPDARSLRRDDRHR